MARGWIGDRCGNVRGKIQHLHSWCFAAGVASNSSSWHDAQWPRPWWPYCSVSEKIDLLERLAAMKESSQQSGSRPQAPSGGHRLPSTCVESAPGPFTSSYTDIDAKMRWNCELNGLRYGTTLWSTSNPFSNVEPLQRLQKRPAQEGQVQANQIEKPRETVPS